MKEFIGNLWTEQDDRKVIRLGFARRFIEDVLGECFHVMQADLQFVRKGGPLMVIETNDGLTSLKSPLSGSILVFNPKARNFPDRLAEEDIIMEVLPDGIKLAQKETVKKAAAATPDNWWVQQDMVEFAQAIPVEPREQVVPTAAEQVVQMLRERDERNLRALQAAARPFPARRRAR